MKPHHLLFHMRYCGHICSKGLQSGRQKWGGMSADPRRTTVCKTVSKTMLEWCENKRYLSSLPVTWLFSRVVLGIIPHLKEDIQGYLLIWKSGPFAVFTMHKWLLSVSTWGLKYGQHIPGPGWDTYHGILVNISWILCIHPKLMPVPRWLQLIHKELKYL